MSSGVARTAAGSYTGTGAALSIGGEKLGFRPKRVTIHRMTTALDKAVHLEGMADASFLKTVPAGTTTLTSTQGVTLEADGFSVGTDAAVNNSGDTYRFFAEE